MGEIIFLPPGTEIAFLVTFINSLKRLIADYEFKTGNILLNWDKFPIIKEDEFDVLDNEFEELPV